VVMVFIGMIRQRVPRRPRGRQEFDCQRPHPRRQRLADDPRGVIPSALSWILASSMSLRFCTGQRHCRQGLARAWC
jgi:hypothetical protein